MARRLESRDQKKRKRTNPEYKSRKMPKRELPSSLVVQDEEPEFPRGGRSILSREVENEVRAEAEEEFDREQGLTHRGKNLFKKKKKKSTGKSLQAAEDEWGSLFGQGITGKFARLTNRITWKIDEERKPIALGMKKSYFEDVKNVKNVGDSDAICCSSPTSKRDDDGGVSVLSQIETRASVLPLQVSLDALEDTHMEGVFSANQDDAHEIMEIEKKKDRHMKKKEETRERTRDKCF